MKKSKYPMLPIYGNLNETETACMQGYEDKYNDDLPMSANPYSVSDKRELHVAYIHGWIMAEWDKNHEN